jgi:hypothetical protein
MRAGKLRVLLAVLASGAALAAGGGLGSAAASSDQAGSLPSAARSSQTAASTAGISFSTPAIADPIHAWGEPTIGVAPSGHVFVSGPTGTGTQRSAWEGSVDGGRTFRVITPNAPPSAVQGLEDPPGGGDTDLNFARSGKQFFVDLYALLCDRVATTSNGGASVKQGFDGCGTNPGSDRPWLAVYDPPPNIPHRSRYSGHTPLVYMEYNNLTGPGPNSGGQWNKSTNGLDYTNATKGVTPATESTYSPFGPDGYPAIDQETGKVFQAAGFPNSNGTYDLDMNIGTPGSAGNLRFLDAPTTSGGGPNYGKLIHIANNLPGSPDTLFSTLSMDSARNLVVVWAVNNTSKPAEDQVYVAASSAASGWRKWTKPFRVSDGSTTTGDAVNVFPWIKAGGPGRADSVWYGSNKQVDPSSKNHQAWNVFMNQVVFPVNSSGAITGQAPMKTLVKVSPHPVHYNDICLQGSGCVTSQGNRNLADFFTVTINHAGGAEIVYDDTSNGLSQPGFTPTGNQTVDHKGAPLATVARQSSGMGLYGHPISAASNAPVSAIGDPNGDARYPVIGGKNVRGMDLRGSSLALSSDGKTLTVKTKVVDLANPSATSSTIPGAAFLQYVTRWQMGNTIYYAGMSNTAANQPSFYAGKAGSVDLCSVSACDPHVITYPESNAGGQTESGKVSCPKSPSATNPCTITIRVAAADIGKPTSTSVLRQVGSYALATSHLQGTTTNAQALADNVPLEIDGACCFDFKASAVAAARLRGGGTQK